MLGGIAQLMNGTLHGDGCRHQNLEEMHYSAMEPIERYSTIHGVNLVLDHREAQWYSNNCDIHLHIRCEEHYCEATQGTLSYPGCADCDRYNEISRYFERASILGRKSL